ncbi:Arm DNA-binding domain-containing protein [Odoribacter sp. Z80]|mgnify:FL=1|uniref:Arm DNA-binding domain-containing protein n=1 Tax=Odoribacter sp. Z80 TaxID=2304575 RepID=UPI001F2E05C6|nr:Arm DNA-binding domain-containing protein [Odoribacter sp. Z80]
MLRIIKDRKSKYQSLGLSIPPQFWDFEKNQPKRNCPNRDAILRLITEKTKEYQQLYEMDTAGFRSGMPGGMVCHDKLVEQVRLPH